MKYGFFIRGQYRQGDDMAARFKELVEQARLGSVLIWTPTRMTARLLPVKLGHYSRLGFP